MLSELNLKLKPFERIHSFAEGCPGKRVKKYILASDLCITMTLTQIALKKKSFLWLTLLEIPALCDWLR